MASYELLACLVVLLLGSIPVILLVDRLLHPPLRPRRPSAPLPTPPASGKPAGLREFRWHPDFEIPGDQRDSSRDQTANR